MPIYLPPLSRRQFLLRALVGGAALACQPALLAANRRTDPDSWALLSDLHIAADPKQVARGINMTEHLGQVSKEVRALSKAPAGIFVTGDCAYNSGKVEDYAQLAELLAPLRHGGAPIHIALGNHDNRERFWEALSAEKTAKRPLADRQVSLVQTPRTNWFVLDSLETTLATPGLLGSEQLAWLSSALDANPKKPAIVLLHHNPGTIANVSGLKDTEALFEVIRPRRQVKAYIFGHSHAWGIQTDSSGIHLINLPPVAYIFREGDPAGWVHATLERHGMRLELRCVDPAHKAHGKVTSLQWRAA